MRRHGAELLGAAAFLAAAGLALLLGPGRGARSVPPPPVAEDRQLVRVLDEDERPVTGARIRVYAVDPHEIEARFLEAVSSGRGGWAAVPGGEGRMGAVAADGFAREVFPLSPRADLYLCPGSMVEGVVVDLRGRPLAGAHVVSPAIPPYAAEATSAADGTFRIGPLADDAWVRAMPEGHAPLELSLSLYPLTGRDFAFYTVREWRVAGRVVDGTGVGVPGALVELDQEARSRVRCDEEGRFEMPGVLPSWEVLLTPRAPGLVGPTVAAEVGQMDVVLKLYRPAAIEGRVVDRVSGAAVRDYEIEWLDAEIGPAGGFRISGLVPGETDVRVEAGSLRGEVPVDLREGERRDGVVVPVDAPRWASPDDYRPLHPVRIRVREVGSNRPAEGTLVRQADAPGGWTRTDAEGLCIVRLPPGLHRLILGGNLEPHASKVICVEVPAEEESETELVRNPDARVELMGAVAEPDSKMWIRCGREWRELDFQGQGASFPATPGSWLDLLVKGYGFTSVERRDVRIPEDGRIPIFPEAGGTIRGRCLGEGRHPMAKVVLETEEDPAHLRTETMGDGLFEVGPMLPGRYGLVVYARNIRTRRFVVDVTVAGVDLGDVHLAAPCELEVLALTSSGAPVPGALVETSHLVPAKGLTDESGRIRLPGRNPVETLRVEKEGYLEAWLEVPVPADRRRVEPVVRLLRPARILIRAVDAEGRMLPVLVPEREDLDAGRGGPGEVVLDGLRPGPLDLALEDREGRTGRLRTVVREGEFRVEPVVLE